MAETATMSHYPTQRRSWARRRYYVWVPILVLVILIAALWVYLDIWTTKYVNRVLGNVAGYQASVREVNVHLYRGAYVIHGLKMYKIEGNIPTPFIDIEQVDIAVQWGALLHGRIVSNVVLLRPILNFAKAKNGSVQTGKDTDWTTPIKQLAPIDINRVELQNGEIHYKDFSANPKVDLFVNNLNGDMTNLRNVEKNGDPLPSEIHGTGDSIGKGKLALDGKMNVLKPIPDMDMVFKLERAELPYINAYVENAAALDFESGVLDVYAKFTVKDGYLNGYVKPIASKIQIISLKKAGNPLNFAWQSVAAFFVDILSNHGKDQFATQIPIQGKLNKPETSGWTAFVGILHNAFVQAMSKDVKDNLK